MRRRSGLCGVLFGDLAYEAGREPITAPGFIQISIGESASLKANGFRQKRGKVSKFSCRMRLHRPSSGRKEKSSKKFLRTLLVSFVRFIFREDWPGTPFTIIPLAFAEWSRNEDSYAFGFSGCLDVLTSQ